MSTVYTVRHGELYYRASRARVRVVVTEELRAEALRTVEGATRAHHGRERPPPLVDSPKCRGCSLVEVCLPDESNLLRLGVDGPSDVVPLGRLARGRRLVASSMESRTITVSTAGVSVRLVLVGSVHASTSAIMACLERSIGVSFHQYNGRLLGSVSVGLGSNVALRAAQHARAGDAEGALSIAREIVRGKIRNQRVLLLRHDALGEAAAGELLSLLRGVSQAATLDVLRGIEGRAARLYFEGYSRLLRDRGGDAFTMVGRSRRPPRDPVNAMLSFGYAMVTRECAEVLRRVGFDPMRGFLHGMGWGRPALGLDLVEEFRVLLVDSTVLRLVAERRVVEGDFHREVQGVALKPGARRVFLQALDQRREEEITHPVFGYRVTYRRAIELQARVLARVIEGEVDRYVALTTR